MLKNNNRHKNDNVVNCSLLQELSIESIKSFVFLKIIKAEIIKTISGVTKVGIKFSVYLIIKYSKILMAYPQI